MSGSGGAARLTRYQQHHIGIVILAAPEPEPDLQRQRAVVDAFFAASRDGDFDALVAMLHPDVELRVAGGTLRQEASLLLRGAVIAPGGRVYGRPHLSASHIGIPMREPDNGAGNTGRVPVV